jgi:exopolysaccharide production protein ExoQ
VLHSIHMPSLPVRGSTRASLFDYGFAVWALLLTADTYGLFRGDARDSLYPSETDPVMQLLFITTYGIVCALLVRRGVQSLRVAAARPLLWIFVGLALLSTTWSAAPSVTLVRSVAFAGTTLLGLYLAVTFDLNELLKLLAWVLGALAVLSVFYALALPQYGLYFDTRGQSWRGIFSHKNILGRDMTFSALVFLALALQNRRHILPWIGFLLSGGLILASDSKTSLLILALLLLIAIGYPLLRLDLALTVPLACAALIFVGGTAAWLWDHLYSALDLLNRDVTLTGRADLWDAVIEMIGQHPWLGYGHAAFWLGMDGPSAYIWALVGWQPPHAHNGFLDVTLELGLLGLILLLLLLGSTFARALTLALRRNRGNQIFPLLFITFILLLTLVESGHLGRNSIFWVTFSALTLMRSQPHPEGTEQS